MNFYTLMFACLGLLLSHRAQAQSWYQDIPDQTVAAGQVLLLDVDNDNGNDLAISGNFINSQLFFALSTPTVGNVGSRNVQLLSNGSNNIAQLQAGQNVFINSGNFIGGQSNNCVICINNSGIWQGGSPDTYIGFRFEKISDNQIHYGWLRIAVNSTVSQLTVKEIGFQRSPNTAAVVGFIPVTSLQIQSSSQLLSIDNAQLQLQAQILPSNASNPNLRWSVDNPIVASINQQGLLTALADGQVLVRAEASDDSGLWDTMRVFVSNQIVEVNRINLSSLAGNQISARNGSLPIIADVQPSYATNRAVVWSVDNQQVASVDNNGLLTAKANGTVNVVATSQDGSRVSGYMEVVISGQFVPVTSLSVQGAGFINSPHGSSQLSALVSPSNADIQQVTWSVDSPHIAEIDQNGLLQAHQNGSVLVTATASDGSGLQNSRIINISGQYILVDTVRVSASGAAAINTNKGSLQLSAVLSPANASNSHFRWAVSDTFLAEISPNGLLRAKNNGTVQVFAICQDNSAKIGQISIPISNQITKCQSLQIQSATGFFSISSSLGSLQLQPIFNPTNTSNQNVVWTVNNPNIAQINSAGLLYGQENGTVTVSAISQDGSGAIGQAVVTISGQSIRMNSLQIQGNSSINTPFGSSQLSLLYSPSNASSPLVYWSCDRTNVAVVSQSGLVQALGNGTVTITATAQDGSGLSASFSVFISNQKQLINSLTVQSGRGSLVINQARDTLQLYPIFSPVAANPPPFFWKSSNPLIATVTNNGLLSAVANGSVTITAISQDGSGLSAQAVVSVSNQPIFAQSVSISSTSGSFAISNPYGELPLQAAVSPNNASQRISWSVDSPHIAFINPNGLLVAKTNGTVKVRAQTMDGSEVFGLQTVVVSNQIIPIQTLDIVASRNFINSHGDTLHLYPNISPSNASNANVIWRSNNENIATVSAQGLLTARTNGTAQIIAIAQDISGLSDTFAVNISNQRAVISGLTVSEQSAQTSISSPNGQLQLIYSYSPATASSPSVVWSLSDNQIGRIFPDGRLVGRQNGTVWAKASAEDGSGLVDSILISVSNQLILLDSIQLLPQGGVSAISTAAGSLQLSANFYPANASNTLLIYKSLQPNLAKVTRNGQVFAYADGTAQIVALSQDGSGQSDTINISISNQIKPITAISISTPSASINTAAGILALSATVSPSNASYPNLFWSVSDTNLAYISPQGQLKARADGTVLITAAAMDGSNVSATFAVSISNQPIWVQTVQVQGFAGQNSININNQTLQMEALVLPLTASNPAVRWQIVGGGTGWATINPTTGVLTPRHNGTVTVRATAQDGSAVYGETLITINNQTAPNPSVASATINAPATFINQDGNPLQLTATFSPAAANLNRIWSVRPAALAHIDQSGLLYPLDNGQVTVTVAAVSNGVSDSFAVSISGQFIPIQNLSISTPSVINSPNGQAQAVASISPLNASNQNLIYVLGQPNLAHIDRVGNITAFADGVLDVWAYSQDGSGLQAHQQISISNQISPINSLVLSSQGGTNAISNPYGQLQTLYNSSPSSVAVYYSSANPAVASINPQGTIQAHSNGLTWIKARALDGSELSDSIQVSVSNQPILTQTITLSAPSSVISVANGSLQLTANISPSNASNPNVLWWVSDPNIAAVSQQGTVTALRNGQVSITAASQDGSGVRGQYVLTVSNQPILANAISITGSGGQNSISQPFGSLQLAANISPSNASSQQVYWSIDNPNIGQLLPNGKIYALRNGSTTVRAHTLDGSQLSATFAISVQNQPTRTQQLVISKSSNSILTNQATAQVAVSSVPVVVSNGQTIIQSLHPNLANINAYGLLTAVQNGFVYIKTYAQDSSEVQALDSVFINNQHQPATSVQISAPAGFEINQPNGVLQLTATASPSNLNPTAFNRQSSNPAIATVYPNGMLVAHSNGTVTISATAADGSQIQQTQTVTVSNQSVQIAAISLSEPNNSHIISVAGGSLQLQANISPSNASNPNLYYFSNNNNIATINQNGLVIAHADGTVILMARSLDGGNIVATYTITVSNQPSLTTSFSIQSVGNSYQIGSSEGTLQFQPNFNPLTVSNQRLAWSLNPSNIASIDDNGLLTAYQNGVVAVSAHTLDGSQLSATRFVTISNQSVYVSSLQLNSSTGLRFINSAFGSLQMIASVSPSNATNAAFSWWVSDPSIASISAGGLLRAHQNGLVTIYAQALDRGKRIDSTQVLVSNQPIYTQQISISPQSGAAVINQPNGSLPLVANISPSLVNNPNIYWWVDNPSVATITQTGELSAKTNGIVNIFAQTQDKSGLISTLSVTVTNQSSSVAVSDIDLFSSDPSNSIFINGATLQLLANVFPTNASNPILGWSVDRLDIIRVDVQGLLSPTGNGSAMAFAHSSDGSRLSALLEISVSNQLIAVRVLANNNPTWSVTAFPNPFIDIIQIATQSLQGGEFALSLYDQQGRLLWEDIRQVGAGADLMSLENLPALVPDLYILKMQHSGSQKAFILRKL